MGHRTTARVTVLALLLAGSGCGFGDQCVGGHEQCVGDQGAYRICGGSETVYWTTHQCEGIEPACQKDESFSRISCLDRATLALCPEVLTLYSGVSPKLTRIIDVNGDGTLDLEFEGALLARGNGAGQFSAATIPNVAVVGQVIDALPANLNGDTNADLVVSSSNPGALFAFFGDNQGNFALANRYDFADPPALHAAADFNGDGRDEIVGTVLQEGIHVLSNLGYTDLVDRLIAAATPADPAPMTWGAIVADFDGVAPLDLAADLGNQLEVYLSTSDGEQRQVKFIYDTRCVGDLDGDGRADVLANGGANPVKPGLSVWFAGKSTDFVRRATLSTPYYFPAGTAVADFNADGLNDVAVTFRNHADVLVLGVFTGTGGGEFAPPTYFSTPMPPRPASLNSDEPPLLVGDIDNDGRADLVTMTDSSVVALVGACLTPR